jgi:hypothetical protein
MDRTFLPSLGMQNYIVHRAYALLFVQETACFKYCFSRRDCQKRKGIWDTCVSEIEKDVDLKKDFDNQMLEVANTAGALQQFSC